jgi:catechol 2,3-dioxygenase-like lactoylglutathione lyase family enzyme
VLASPALWPPLQAVGRHHSREIRMPELDEPSRGGWPSHLHPGALRWVRSSTHYDETIAFYRDLVGLPVVDSFRDSYGEDGTIFGLPDTATHMEIVRSRQAVAPADRFDQIVFYLSDENALTQAIAPLLRAGIARDPAPHAYWRANGAVVFLDPDGRAVVYAAWVFGQAPDPVDGVP